MSLLRACLVGFFAVAAAATTGCAATTEPTDDPAEVTTLDDGVETARAGYSTTCTDKCKGIADRLKKEACYFDCLCTPVVINGVPMCQP